MDTLSRQRCFNHGSREAAARCPECGRFFCRECVTEHDDRVLCASCVEKQNAGRDKGRSKFRGLKSLVFLCFGFVLLFLVFYYAGVALMMIPSEFHKGGLW
ncbi:MAG: hypothetical protein WC799_06415 [Desulfobacteraceae bacterium]|jgi:hypothetical protein